MSITENQNAKSTETVTSSAHPLEAAVKKVGFAEKELVCLSGGKADTSSSSPQKRFF
ncbi:MAG: hypothetical protein Q4G42_02400 [Neisseria sp.]|nr:hypothetical protein [Neisseria sp.]